jgi:ATP-binding cassette subfamily B protein RaxB
MIKPIFQESVTDCGLACVAMIAGYHGHNLSVRQLEARFRIGCNPLSAHDIVQLSSKLNMHSRVLRLEPEEMPELKTPCILHWKINHYVILESIANGKWYIVDPAVGRRTISRSEVDRLFTGVALEFSPSESFVARKPSSPISLISLAKGLVGEVPKLTYIILITIGLEAITLLVPLISQLIIDGAITSQDKDFLLIAAIGGVLLVTSQFALGVAGDIARLKLNQSVGLKWSSNLFLHLIKLPWPYFQHRQLGEISSRFAALKPIKEFLLLTLTSTLIDLLVLVSACALMAMYNIILLWTVVAACACYAIVQLVFYPFLREATAERLILSAREHAYFLESIRSALTLKMTGNLAHRSSQWNNLLIDVQNRDTATQKIQIMASAANTLIFGIESMLVLYIGGNLIIEAGMSIGMLVAFMGFKSHFTNRLSRVIDTLIQWRMQSVHCDRLADIALHQTEESHTSNQPLSRQPLKIELINVSFRHNEQSPWIVKDINLTILPGESLAITGRSGSGKSTLAKLILGLLDPCEGQILINGIAIGEIGVTELRAVTGTVLQEDQMLCGTIAENITGFELESCMTQAQCVARLANLHHVINKLSMGYQTVISNTCSTLSSGQRQRLFLARALYKSPNLLVLDEATNNLDMHSEQHVISSLKGLPLTLITIAHRRESLSLASRFIQMEKGRIVTS